MDEIPHEKFSKDDLITAFTSCSFEPHKDGSGSRIFSSDLGCEIIAIDAGEPVLLLEYCNLFQDYYRHILAKVLTRDKVGWVFLWNADKLKLLE
jgi:hypothetical protein